MLISTSSCKWWEEGCKQKIYKIFIFIFVSINTSTTWSYVGEFVGRDVRGRSTFLFNVLIETTTSQHLVPLYTKNIKPGFYYVTENYTMMFNCLLIRLFTCQRSYPIMLEYPFSLSNESVLSFRSLTELSGTGRREKYDRTC